MQRKNPLLSVVIPTFARPQFLKRSIRSALRSAPEGDVEIIVVPNGGGDEWKAVAKQFVDCPQVSWWPREEPNACLARNYGMSLAKGKYLRFLDDDDYLLEGAYQQLLIMDGSHADVCQGGIDWIDSLGAVMRSQSANDAGDFICAVLEPDFFTLLHSFIWLRSKREVYPWDQSLKIGDDLAFALAPALQESLNMIVCDFPVGAWVHHQGSRISTGESDLKVAQSLASVLLHALHRLDENNMLTSARKKAIADRLWQLAHSQFPRAPLQWTQTIFNILAIDPASRPNDAMFQHLPLRLIHPLMAEWLLFPHRRIRRWAEKISCKSR